MAPTDPSTQPAEATTAAKLKRSRSLSTQLSALLLDCPSRQALFDKVLQIGREHFSATVGRVAFRIGDKTEVRLTHDERIAKSLADRFNADYLRPLCEEIRAAAEPEPKLKRFERGEQRMTLISAPIVDVTGKRIEGAITLMIGGGRHSPNTVLPALDGIAAMASTVLAVKSGGFTQTPNDAKGAGETVPPSSRPTAVDSGAQQVLLENNALARTAQFSSVREFAYSIVNSLCGQLQAEQVFFGVEKKQKISVEAVSGIPDFKASSPGIAIVRQAMEECLDYGKVIVAQQKLPSEMTTSPIHQQWSTESLNSCVCSIPLRQNGEVTSVISVRRPASKPFQLEELEKLERSLAPYGAAARVVEKASRTLGQQLKSNVSDSAKRNLAKGTLGRKLFFGGLLAGVLWFLFGSMTYRPICQTTVTAADLRHFSAPFDGKLSSVMVRPGQTVSAGDVLVEFDTADLRLELNGLLRQMSAAEVELRQAIYDDDMSLAALARSQINVLQTQASATRKRISDARIVAPTNGTVILSDLEQRVGQVFSHGEELLQLAQEGDWLLEIEVPDDIVTYVAAEQHGTFAASSLPTEKQEFTIQHIDGAASVVADRNVFIARAPLDAHPVWMKSGMQGTAQLETVPRPVWWVVMHRVVDWFRTSFWI